MNSTLTAFASTLLQVAARSGPAFSAKGVLVAGIAALAITTPARADVTAEVVGEVEPPSLAEGPAASSEATLKSGRALGLTGVEVRDIARLVAGVLDSRVGRVAAPEDTGLKILAVSKSLQNRTRSEAASLPIDLQDRMTGLVIEAAATRMLAQESILTFKGADAVSAAEPSNVAVQRSYIDVRSDMNATLIHYQLALANLRSAVSATVQSGYRVQRYAEIASAMPVDLGEGDVQWFDHPAIKHRADDLRGRLAISARPAVTVNDLSDQAQRRSQEQRPAERP